MGTTAPRVMPTVAGERYMLWVLKSDSESPVCNALDVAAGEQLAIEPVSRYRHEGRRSIARFTAQSTQTQLACSGRRQTIYLTTAYDEGWMRAHLFPVFAPFLGFTAAGGLCLWLGLRQPRQARG